MEEIIEKVENLKKELEKNYHIVKIKKLNKEIMKDKDLLKLIEKYRETSDLSIKTKILDNNLFREYKMEEFELNLLILNINNKLKQITNKDGCNYEDNKWKI